MKRLFLIVCFLFISGCAAQYEDVSRNIGYSHLMGTQYELVQEMYITGINLPPGYGKDINLYIISPIHPTWKGPENISRYALPKGTTYEILGMRRCTNCFEKTIRVAVEVPSYYKAAPVPVEIDLKYIQPDYVIKIK